MTKALITGITGMAGSHLADYLLKNTNWDVYGVARWRSSLDNIQHLLERVNNNDKLFMRYGDMNDQVSLITILTEVKPDYIFHLAAQSYPLAGIKAPIDTLNINILGTASLLESVKVLNQNPIIHVCSSNAIFCMSPYGNLSVNPTSIYAISETCKDLLGRYYAEAYNMHVMTTKTCVHTGPRRGDVFAESAFAKKIVMIEDGLSAPVIEVDNLDLVCTWADVRDIARAYYMLVTVKPLSGAYYDMVGTHTCKLGDVLDILLSFSTVKDIKVKYTRKSLSNVVDVQTSDFNKFGSHTGWAPEYTFEQTMSDLLDYWRRKLKGKSRVMNFETYRLRDAVKKQMIR
ncbi:MAG: GDP-mannose 4,6-dehydratase [Endomicrobium sp.]|jgi:GDPmannose 4,6-dehydratase|nr:GDP-mannose 4,6-dehydratase [Endomicrobium sp.]